MPCSSWGIFAVLARLLAPTDFGVVSAALVVIGLSGIFSQLVWGRRSYSVPSLRTVTLTGVRRLDRLGVLLGGLVDHRATRGAFPDRR